jgi:hypothetical protein
MGARSFWRGGCLVVGGVAICAAGAPAANASVRVNSWEDFRFPTGAHLDVDPVRYREVADDRVVIGFDQSAGRYYVTDQLGAETLAETCRQESPTAVRCDPASDPASVRVSAFAGYGTDSIRLDSSLVYRASTLFGSTLIGGGQHDRLLGTRTFVDGGDTDGVLRGRGGNDVLKGHGGDDELSGGSGDDRLIGGPGADTITGGAGDDRIRERDRDAEARIDCGPGEDVARIGRNDPRPVDCEVVARSPRRVADDE